MEEGKELAVVKDLGKALVEYNDDLGFDGFEGAEGDAGSYAIPFLKVLQALSPARTEGIDEYIEGSKNGDFYNSVTDEIYDRSMNLIIVTTERVFNEYKPSRGGFVGTHNRVEGEKLIRDKSEYPYVSIGKGPNRTGAGNNLVETLTFICLNADQIKAGPIIFPLSSTSLKHAKSFLSRASMLEIEKEIEGVMVHVKAPLYSSIYNFETKLQSNDEGKWWQILKSSIKRVGAISDIQKVAVADAFALFREKGVDYAKGEETEVQNEMDFGNDTGENKKSIF